MRPLSRFFLVAVCAFLPLGIVATGVLAQDVDTAQFADCLPGRPPTTPEAGQLMELEDGKDYLAWEGVCEPIPNGDLVSPPGDLGAIIDLRKLQEEGVLDPRAAELLASFDDEVAQNPDFAFQPYGVAFMQDWAATLPIRPKEEVGENPETYDPARQAEFMVVYVVQGQFVLDVLPENGERPVLVTTAGDGFQLTEPWNPSAPEPHYVVTDVFLVDQNGDKCTVACPVNPGEPVVLKAGDYAIADQGVICRYCLEQSAIDDNGVHGLLQVFALKNPDDPEAFSWIQSWRSINSGQTYGGPPTRLAWAFPNLSTGCKDK